MKWEQAAIAANWRGFESAATAGGWRVPPPQACSVALWHWAAALGSQPRGIYLPEKNRVRVKGE